MTRFCEYVFAISVNFHLFSDVSSRKWDLGSPQWSEETRLYAITHPCSGPPWPFGPSLTPPLSHSLRVGGSALGHPQGDGREVKYKYSTFAFCLYFFCRNHLSHQVSDSFRLWRGEGEGEFERLREIDLRLEWRLVFCITSIVVVVIFNIFFLLKISLHYNCLLTLLFMFQHEPRYVRWLHGSGRKVVISVQIFFVQLNFLDASLSQFKTIQLTWMWLFMI